MAEHDEPLDENEADLDDVDDVEGEDDPEDDDDLEDEDDGGARCPICGVDFDYEVGPCPHLVSSLSSIDDCWEWWPDTSKVKASGRRKGADQESPATLATPEEFVQAVSDLVAASCKTDEKVPLKVLKKLFPRRLHAIVLPSIEEERLAGSEAEDYIHSLIAKAPTFAGSVDCETCSACNSSFWSNYYARDAAACGRAVEEQLGQDVLAIRAAIDKLAAEGGASKSGEGS